MFPVALSRGCSSIVASRTIGNKYLDYQGIYPVRATEFLAEDFLYPVGSEIPANIKDFRDPKKTKRWFEPYTPEDINRLQPHGFIPTGKGRWVEHGKTFVVLTKDNGVIVFWYDNYSNLLPSLREVFAVVDQNIDKSLQDEWDSIMVYKNGYLLNRSRKFGSWSGNVNKYSQEIQKTAQALLDRKIATTSTPLWIGNWAAGKGEYIGSVGKIVAKTELPDKLVLYHGTSSYRLQIILRDGLKPIDLEYRVWNKGGLEKQRPEHRETSIYLTASRPQAEYYAKKATDTDRARYNVNYRRGQRSQIDRLLSTIRYMEWELAHKDDPNVKQVGWREQDLADAKEKLEKIKQQPVFYGKFEPVILQITITKSQYSKLMADDDYLRQHPNSSATDWYDSLSYFGQVAFQGTVPPSKIKVVAQGKSAAQVSYE